MAAKLRAEVIGPMQQIVSMTADDKGAQQPG